jgi:hypothetical protein
MFVFPVPENELEGVVGKLRAGFDVIPEYLVMKCIQYIKKPLAHIFNASLKSGIFPDKMDSKSMTTLEKDDGLEICSYRSIFILSVF